jgi:hypothetical protein
MGAEGGRETFRRNGRKHTQVIGSRGFATLVARHFSGDKQAALAWLHAHAVRSEIHRLVAEKQEQQIADGATCENISSKTVFRRSVRTLPTTRNNRDGRF